MALEDELRNYAAKTHADSWARREGRVVPDTDSLTLKNEAVDLDGTVLYADLADSTGLVSEWKDWFAAEVYKNYLYAASRIIRACGGEITAYDGDRVMGVFIGGSKNTDAASCGLKINYAVLKIIQPAMQAQYSKNKFTLRHKVGIDTSPLMVAKTGTRDSNDLVWVGKAANNAAKLAGLSANYATYISGTVHEQMARSSKYGGDPERHMWTDLGVGDLGSRVYGSTWWRSV